MNEVVKLSMVQFSLIYILLVIVLLIMKCLKMEETKVMFVASMRMTVQLILAGLILSYVFKHPYPIYTAIYLTVMIVFAIYQVLSRRKGLNLRFQLAVAISLSVAVLFVVFFFVTIVVGKSFFAPQYAIPIGGMIVGNAMTGVSLGMCSFLDSIKTEKDRIETLLNFGAEPKKILLPFINHSLGTALLPTMNTTLGMGIVSLPGMMTGQILAGTFPMTAIFYQIAIMVAISASVCLSVFLSLNLGYRTLIQKNGQITLGQ